MLLLNFSYDWKNTPSHIILNGVDKKGVKLIVLLLRDYVSLTNEMVNPSCEKCLNNYIKFIKSKYMNKSENTSNFVLKAKYEGIPLEFGSPVYVSNENITDEYGIILLNRFLDLGTPPEAIFAKFPDEYKTVAPEVAETKKDKPAKTDKVKEVKTTEVKEDPAVKTTEPDEPANKATTNEDEDIIIVD